MQVVAIVDYRMGNVDSVVRAVQECGGTAQLTGNPDELRHAAAVILPGVGAFAQGMSSLTESGLDVVLHDIAGRGIPLLGVCLGMQLLATRGTEGGDTPGLDLIPGTVEPIPATPGLRVPHMGWNQVDWIRPSRLLGEIPSGLDFYFVHSYRFAPSNEADVIATSPYGPGLVAAVERDNVYGVQFHPEKSQRAGLSLLRRFLELSGANSNPHALMATRPPA